LFKISYEGVYHSANKSPFRKMRALRDRRDEAIRTPRWQEKSFGGSYCPDAGVDETMECST
jgi:hypothetical protein